MIEQKSCTKASESEERKLKLIRWLLWITVVLGIPVFFYWAVYVAVSGTVDSSTEECIYLTIPIIAVILNFADVSLSVGMLLIFVIPL
jgi:hypothetical protein